jgi:hypothetical protein
MLEKSALLDVTADGFIDPTELQDLLLNRFSEGDTSLGVSGARINIPELLSMSWESKQTPKSTLSIDYSDVSDTKNLTALISVLKSNTFVLVTEESEGFPTKWIDSMNFRIETEDGRTLDLELYGDVKASETKNVIQNTSEIEALRSVSMSYKDGSKEISKYEVSTSSINGDLNRGANNFKQDVSFDYHYKDADSSLSLSYLDRSINTQKISAPTDQDGNLIIYQQWSITSDIEGSYSYQTSDQSTKLSFDFRVSESWTDTLKNLGDAEGFFDRPPQVEIRNFVLQTPTSITRSDYSLFTAPSPDYWDNLTLGYSNEKIVSTLAVRQEAEKEMLPYLSSIKTVSPDSAQSSTLDLIVDILGQVRYLKGLTETVTSSSHTIEYQGVIFDYKEVDAFITVVTRNGEFTEEFSTEIADAYPSVAGIKYETAVLLVGQSEIESVLIAVAGADGNYVG